MKQTPSC